MPFDLLEIRNPIQYNLSEGADDETRKAQKAVLVKNFGEALKLLFDSEEYRDLQPAPEAIKYREPKNGMARFRAKGQPIGFIRDAMAQVRQVKGAAVYLESGPAAWLRIMPQNPIRQWELDQVKNSVPPLAVAPFYEAPEPPQETRGIDGWGYSRTNRGRRSGNQRAFLFTDAEIWTINTFFMNVQEDVVFVEENRFVQTLEVFVEFLAREGVPPPYRWIAGIEGLLDRYLPSQYGVGFGPGPSTAKIVYREGTLKQGDKPSEALEPFFTELYAAFGASRSFGLRR